MTEETWKDIPDNLGFQASDLGRVRTCWVFNRKRGYRMTDTWQIRRIYERGEGYKHVRLALQKNILLHRVILTTFVGPMSGHKINAAHLNGDPSDNRLCNLAWVTARENNRQKKLHGREPFGELRPNAKLTYDKAMQIRVLVSGGMRHRKAASLFGVSIGIVRHIIRGVTYLHRPGSVVA